VLIDFKLFSQCQWPVCCCAEIRLF